MSGAPFVYIEIGGRCPAVTYLPSRPSTMDAMRPGCLKGTGDAALVNENFVYVKRTTSCPCAMFAMCLGCPGGARGTALIHEFLFRRNKNSLVVPSGTIRECLPIAEKPPIRAVLPTVQALASQGGEIALDDTLLFDIACSNPLMMSPSLCGSDPYPCGSLTYRTLSSFPSSCLFYANFTALSTQQAGMKRILRGENVLWEGDGMWYNMMFGKRPEHGRKRAKGETFP